ncbi:unnamed protein product, partial [Symbiodinium sp. CCMP2592]
MLDVASIVNGTRSRWNLAAHTLVNLGRGDDFQAYFDSFNILNTQKWHECKYQRLLENELAQASDSDTDSSEEELVPDKLVAEIGSLRKGELLKAQSADQTLST